LTSPVPEFLLSEVLMSAQADLTGARP
jgi:hypothetical protein